MCSVLNRKCNRRGRSNLAVVLGRTVVGERHFSPRYSSRFPSREEKNGSERLQAPRALRKAQFGGWTVACG